jgi:hypothetical protein
MATVGSDTLWVDVTPRSAIGKFGKSTLFLMVYTPDGDLRALGVDLAWGSDTAAIRSVLDGKILGQARLIRRRRGGFVMIPADALPPVQRLFVKLECPHGFFDKAGWREVPAPKPSETLSANSARERVCTVIPCYNVADVCEPVIREAMVCSGHVIAIDDGSTDGTGDVLHALKNENPERITILSPGKNRGKGHALMAGFRYAIANLDFGVLVTIDSDGQHCPQDIPLLVEAWRRGAEFVVGARLEHSAMPLRSRIGNGITRALVEWFFPGCPVDTQSGFRAMDRTLLKKIVANVKGRRYETEMQILLLVLGRRFRVDTVCIPTIYCDGNRESHFRPVGDSVRILGALARWSLLRARPQCRQTARTPDHEAINAPVAGRETDA